jgi:DNA polymerase III delta prime subunit
VSRAASILDKLKTSENGVHALLLYGPRGAGKAKLGEQMISHWLGNERAQQAYERGANPDVLRIEPQGLSRNILVSQIRPSENSDEGMPLTEFLRTQPLYSKHKVVVISDCDRLLNNASNALLKTLEEPAAYAKIILTTTTISRVRQTILSRCLVVACELPGREEMSHQFPESDSLLRELSEDAPGVLIEMQKTPELYLPISALSDELASAPPESVLYFSGRIREIAEEMDSQLKLGSRAANARCLELLAIAMTRRHPEHTQAIETLIKAHRRIEGNVASGLVFDATFAEILVK